MEEQKAKMAAQADKPPKKGFMASMMERAEAERGQRQAEPKKQDPKSGPRKPGPQKKGSGPSQQQRKRKPGPGRQAWLKPRRGRYRPSDDLEEQADAAADFVEELLARMDIDAIAEPNAHEGRMYVDIVDGPEDDMALLIGRHGQTLDAIQELTRRRSGAGSTSGSGSSSTSRTTGSVVRPGSKSTPGKLAEQVAQSGEEQELEPMNAYERKLVHDAVAEIDGVETESRGEDPDRYVVILPA